MMMMTMTKLYTDHHESAHQNSCTCRAKICCGTKKKFVCAADFQIRSGATNYTAYFAGVFGADNLFGHVRPER